MWIFFMGFISYETEHTFKWFFMQFISFYKVSHKFLCWNQDMACINAIIIVLLESHIILDEFHLKQNQLKRSLTLFKENSSILNCELHELCRTPSDSVFFRRRSDFVRKYFQKTNFCSNYPDSQAPQWFLFMYYTLLNLFFSCCIRQRGIRFYFRVLDILNPSTLLLKTE